MKTKQHIEAGDTVYISHIITIGLEKRLDMTCNEAFARIDSYMLKRIVNRIYIENDVLMVETANANGFRKNVTIDNCHRKLSDAKKCAVRNLKHITKLLCDHTHKIEA